MLSGSQIRYIGLTTGIATLFFLAGHLGLMMAVVPPGYATAIWPASGIAVAALLIYGYKFWPGIVLGSFLVNFTLGFELPSSIDLKTVVIPLCIAFGGAAQALLGTMLVRQLKQSDPGFLQFGNIVKLLMLGGPVSCQLNPTWGCVLLLLSGQVGIAELPIVWATWWAGDSIGVLIFLPLTMIWLGKPRPIWHKRKLTVALPVLIFFCISVLAFILTSIQEQKKLELEFAEKGEIISDALGNKIAHYLEITRGMQSFFTSSDDITHENFQKFVGPTLERVPGIYGVSWSRNLKANERVEYERIVRPITEIDDVSGRLVPAADRPEYMVIHFIEPYGFLKQVLGYDAGSDPARAAAARKARDSGELVASNPVSLIPDKLNQEAMIIFAPVYRTDSVPIDKAGRRDKLRGHVIMAIRLSDMLAAAFKKLKKMDLEASLYDVTDSDSTNPLMVYHFDDKKVIADQSLAPDDGQKHMTFAYSKTYDIAGRQWRLMLTPDYDYLSTHRSWVGWGTLTIALLTSSLLSLFLLVMTGRWILDESRAEELAKSNEGLNREMTQRFESEQALYAEKERAQVTLRSIGDGVITTNADGYIDFLNPIAENLTGWTVNEAKGQPLAKVFTVIDEETRRPVVDPLALCLNEGEVISMMDHMVLISRTGMEYCIEDSAAPMRTNEGEIIGVVLVFKDVTEARLLSRQVIYQASHDTLTGLINRHELERRLQRVLDTACENSTENAFCYLDLDQFKLVNDTCGHIAGDELLRQVGQLLQHTTRKRDTVARLGGDEFALMFEHCSIEEAQKSAENVVKAVDDYTFVWDKHSFSIGASIGMIAVNCSSGDISTIMSCADAACYMAKELGRNRVHLHQDEDEQLARRHGEMHWAVSLPNALEEDRFELYFQRIVSVSDIDKGQKNHYEILLRLREHSGNLVAPGMFLPAAERYQLSDKIDRWVINHTFKWLQSHPSHLKQLNLCSINLSGLSLSEGPILSFIMDELKSSEIPPEKICFEITETVAIANLTSATTFINSLRDLGCCFALDDFGSGLSSFAYLKNLPVDFLKIDGVFVKDILNDLTDMAMVNSINEIGHIMGTKTIAEFVENEEILNKLRVLGIDYAQGYCIDKPCPINGLLTQETIGA